MLVTRSGMLMQVREWQFEKACFPILFTLLGMLYVLLLPIYAIMIVLSSLNKVSLSNTNDLDSLCSVPCQHANGFPSILITLFGILMLVRESQSEYVDIIGYQLFVVNTVEKWMCFLLAYGRKPRFNVFNLILQEKCEFEVAKWGKWYNKKDDCP